MALKLSLDLTGESIQREAAGASDGEYNKQGDQQEPVHDDVVPRKCVSRLETKKPYVEEDRVSTNTARTSRDHMDKRVRLDQV